MPRNWAQLGDGSLAWSFEHLPRILLILALSFIAVRAGRRLLGRLEHRLHNEEASAGRTHHRAGTLISILNNVLSITVWSIALLQFLAEIGVKLGPMLAGAGIAGVAVGFGAQSLVRDFLTGFFVLLEDQYRLGDQVRINGASGVVERFSLRMTGIRALDGTLHSVANGSITQVANTSSGWSQAIVDIGAPYSLSLSDLHSALDHAGRELMEDSEVKHLVLEPPAILGVEDFATNSMQVRVAIKTLPGAHAPVGRSYRQSVKNIFDEEGINLDSPGATLLNTLGSLEQAPAAANA